MHGLDTLRTQQTGRRPLGHPEIFCALGQQYSFVELLAWMLTRCKSLVIR
jgi:hypothetical protein